MYEKPRVIFPLLVLILNLAFRRTLRGPNRALVIEVLFLLGISQLPFVIVKALLFTAYALLLAFARFYFLRVGQALDRFTIRYARQEPRNTWQIVARELTPRNFLLLSALLCTAVVGAFASPVLVPAWAALLLIIPSLALYVHWLPDWLGPTLNAAYELYKGFSVPGKNKGLLRAERQSLPAHLENNADLPDILFIVCESLSKRILESDEGRNATPCYQEFLRRESGRTVSFPRAIANSSTSDIAYATLFTGLSPDSSSRRFHHQPLVWSAARARGYHTSFYTSQSFSWLNMGAFFFDDTLDIAVSRETLDAPCANDLAMDDRLLNSRILEDWKSPAFPRFCTVNYNMLHVPCLVEGDSPTLRKQSQYNRYLLALRIFDECFAGLVRGLEEAGRMDRTAIVFTGDHGEMPRTGAYLDPEQSPDRLYRFHPDILRVPLWIRLPERGIQPSHARQLSENRGENVSNLDLYPTLLDLTGYPRHLLAAEPGGSSLCQPLATDRKIIALNANDFRGWNVEPFAFLKKNHLFIYQDMSRRFELFDIQNPVAADLWPQLPQGEQKRWLFGASRHSALRRLLKMRGIRHEETAHARQVENDYNQRINEGESAPLHLLNNWHLFSAQDWEEFCLNTARIIEVKNGDHVFEAGCGAGAFLDVLQRHYQAKIEGVDLAENLIEIARKRLPGRFWTGDIQRMPYVPSVTYDVAVAHGVFLYLPSMNAVQNATVEMLRVTKPGGTVYIGVMNDPDRIATYQSEHKPSGQAVVARSFWAQFARENLLGLKILDQEAIYQKSSGYDAHSRLRYSVCLHKPVTAA